MSVYSPVGNVDWAPLVFFDVHISQSWREIAAILGLVQEYHIGFVVELGLDRGGLGLFLAIGAFLHEDFGYLGLEIHGENIPSQVLSAMAKFGGRVQLIAKDVLTQDCVDFVKHTMGDRARPALIFCDNGDKPRELRLYAPLCRPGDLIAVHDYTIEIQEADCEFLPAMGFAQVGLFGRTMIYRKAT